MLGSSKELVQRLSDPAILKTALDNLPDNQRPRFLKGLGSSDEAIYDLFKHLTPKEIERTYLISVTLESNDAKGSAETLYAVVLSLIQQLEKEQEMQYDSRLQYLKSEWTNTSKRIQDAKNHILDIANHFKNRSLLRADYSSDLGKLGAIQQHYWEAEALSLTKKAELEEAAKDRDELAKISLDAFARDQVANNFGINQIEQWTYGKSQELRASIDGLQPANPDRIYTEERMKLMNDYLTSYKERVSNETIKNLTDKRKFESRYGIRQGKECV